jgi:hypothetical protein
VLGLELTEPADHADIEASNTSSTAAARPTPPSLRSKEMAPANPPPSSRLPTLSSVTPDPPAAHVAPLLRSSPAAGGLIEVPEGPP